METTHVVVLVLVLAVAGGAAYMVTRPAAAPVYVPAGEAQPVGAGYEVAAVIGASGTAVAGILGGIGGLIGSAGTAAGNAAGGGRAK